MGIPRYFRNIQTRFPRSVRPVGSLSRSTSDQEYDHLYFDLNNLLYGAISATPEEPVMFQRLFAYLDSVVHYARPKSTVFIAIDGPGPKAKILTQRARRMARADEREKEVLQEKEIIRIDSLQFTPGTRFMNTLKESLCYYAGKLVVTQLDKNAKNQPKCYVSGADDCGEGELKIFEHLKTLVSNEERSQFRKNEQRKPLDFLNDTPAGTKKKQRCLIVGNDSDLILFSLRNSHLFDIDILKIDNDLTHNILSISDLRRGIIEDVYGTKAITPKQESEIINDFAVLSLFNGNDYIPRLRPFSFIKVWVAYCMLRRTSDCPPLWNDSKVEGNNPDEYKSPSINQSVLKNIFKTVSVIKKIDSDLFKMSKMPAEAVKSIEKSFEKKKFSYRPILSSDSDKRTFKAGYYCDGVMLSSAFGKTPEAAEEMAAIFALPKLKRMYQEECFKKTDYLSDALCDMKDVKDYHRPYYIEEEQYRFDPDTKEEKKEQVRLYLEGIAWIMEYFRGNCKDYSFNFPFSVGPTANEIALSPLLEHPIPVSETDELPLSPIEFLLTVSPLKQCKEFIPKHFASYLDNHAYLQTLDTAPWRKEFDTIVQSISTGVKTFINDSACKDTAHFNTLKESHVFIPPTSSLLKDYTFVPPRIPSRQTFTFPRDSAVCLSTKTHNIRADSKFTSVKNSFMRPRRSSFPKE